MTFVERVAETVLPTRHGSFRMLGYRDAQGTEHVALVRGLSAPPRRPPLVRLHSECLTGDAFGSWRCDCGDQLDAALERIAAEGEGAVLYLRGHEGRGIGLLEKLKAYALQDRGVDTVDANLQLGHGADERSYAPAAGMLADLGVHRIRLLSSNPAKEEALAELGVEVAERVALFVAPHPENLRYLDTKRERMGHDRPVDVWSALLAGRVPLDEDPLVERYGPMAGEPSWVVAQLAQSLDGFVAARTGDARFVSGEEDRAHLHRLRALADAVVVGGATVLADDPRLTVRAVPGDHPVRVVTDPRGQVPPEAAVLSDGQAPTLWYVGPEVPAAPVGGHVEVVRLPAAGAVAPRWLVDDLRRRGLERILVEGGGRLVSSFVAAGAVDRLWLTTAPLLIGDGVPGLRFTGHDRVGDALRAPARRFLLGEDLVTELDLSAARAPRAAAPSRPSRAGAPGPGQPVRPRRGAAQGSPGN